MNRIMEVLKTQGRSQTWLAKQLECSYAVMTNYCNNKTQPSKAVLRKVAKVLEVYVKELDSAGDSQGSFNNNNRSDRPSMPA